MSIELQKFCDKKTMSGYGSALLYRDIGEEKYHLLLPLETVPTPEGSVDTFEYDLLTCKSKGQIEGKTSLEQKEVDFLWHRDNVLRLQELEGRVLDFLAVFRDFTAKAYSGTIKVKPQDATNDIFKGTLTITPVSIKEEILLDCRDLIQDTCWFISSVPDTLKLAKSGTKTFKINVTPNDATVTVTSTSSEIVTATNQDITSSDSTITGKEITVTAKTVEGNAMLSITASKTGFASWTTTMIVEVE